MLRVVPVMAPLAQCAKVGWVAIFRRVVEVGDGKHHFDGFGKLPILCSGFHNVRVIFYATELATIIRPLQYLLANFFPVRRIAFPIFGFYGHSSIIYYLTSILTYLL